jgi:D-glycero-D-manno-heptose 1,7-bisphosphate phosphatase
MKIIEGVTRAVELIKSKGFIPIIVSNQPDVSRRICSEEDIISIDKIIQEKVKIDYIFNCFHDDNDNCVCRKPKVGLLHFAANDLEIDLTNSYLVGDRWKDIEAGNKAGCTCFFIDYKYNEQLPTIPYIPVQSLLEAAIIITEELNGNPN